MYKLSARQILAVALISAIFAAGAIAIVDRIANRVQPATAAFTETRRRLSRSRQPSPMNKTTSRFIARLSPGVVNVHSTSYARDFFGFVEPQEGSGSGSVIDQEGNILTNYHVIEGATKLAVSFGGQKNYAAQLVGGDPDTDLAVIRLVEKPKEALTIIPLGDSDKLEVGQKVLAIGNPFGLDRTLDHWRDQRLATSDPRAQWTGRSKAQFKPTLQSIREIPVVHCSTRTDA